MDNGILVLGEVHLDLYYENDFFEELVDKIVNRIYNFLSHNPDDFSRYLLKKLIVEVFSKLPKKIVSKAFINRGGNGNNSAESLSKLGIPVKLISVIGIGTEWMIKELTNAGINAEDIYNIEELTPISTIIKSNITTKIFLAPELKDKMNFEGIIIPEENYRDYKIIFTTPYAEKYQHIFEKCHELDMITAFNIELQKFDNLEQLNSVLKHRYDILFINLEDALYLINKKCELKEADDIFKKWARIRIYTKGHAGSSILTDTITEIEVPIVKVDVIDRTGAGDCYAAGFLTKIYELVRNKTNLNILLLEKNSKELENVLNQCGLFASYTSAYKISKQKAPNKKEIENFIQLIKSV